MNSLIIYIVKYTPPTSIMSEWGIYQNELSELSSSSMVVEHTQKRIFSALRNLRLCVTQRASWKLERDKFPQRVFGATIGNLSIQKWHQLSKIEPKLILPNCAGKTVTKCRSNPAELCSLYCKLRNGAPITYNHSNCNKIEKK